MTMSNKAAVGRFRHEDTVGQRIYRALKRHGGWIGVEALCQATNLSRGMVVDVLNGMADADELHQRQGRTTWEVRLVSYSGDEVA